jgi:hypothetical protein
MHNKSTIIKERLNQFMIFPGLFLVIVFTAIFLYLFITFTFGEIRRLMTMSPDDSAYFFNIANNFVNGNGFSFDGIHSTNGFQPLWQYFLIVVSYIIKGSPEQMYRFYYITQILLLILASFFYFDLVIKRFSWKVVLLSGLLYIRFVILTSVNGMESAILVLSFSAFMYFWDHLDRSCKCGTNGYLLFGILVGLIVLSRLDMVFVVVSIYFSLLLFRMGKCNIRRLLLISFGIAIILMPYLLYNYLIFGRVMPISGALKSSFPNINNPINIFFAGWLPTGIAFASLIYILRMAYKNNKKKDAFDSYEMFTFSLSFAVILHFIYTVLFVNWAVFSWHFIPYYFLVPLIIYEPVELIFKSMKKTIIKTAYLFLLLLFSSVLLIHIFRLYQVPLDHSFNVASYDAALWVRRNTNVDDIFAMKDAGIFGYFSKRRVINLDGVVNNFKYQQILKDQKLNEYLKTEGVTFFVQHAMWNTKDVTNGNYRILRLNFISHLYQTISDDLVLRKDDEVYRFHYFDGPYETAFIIWNLNQKGHHSHYP